MANATSQRTMFQILRQDVIPLVMFGVIIFLLYAYTYKSIETNVGPASVPASVPCIAVPCVAVPCVTVPCVAVPCVADDGQKKSSINLERNTNLEELSKGKTKVLWFNGKQFERLYDFCKWTPSFECTVLRVPQERIPIFHQDPALDPIMKRYLSEENNEEMPKIRILTSELEKHPESIFLDIGANVGVFTLTIAKSLKRKVIAVEPVFTNVAQLCRSIQENGLTDNVTVVFNPLSDQHTQVDMTAPLERLVTSQVQPLSSQQFQNKGNSSCPKKPAYNTVCLDDLLPYMTSKTAVIKIDVQSYEYNTFKGAQKFMDAIDVTLIFMEWILVKNVPNADKFVEMLKTRSYVSYAPDGKVLDNNLYKSWPADVVWRKKTSV